MRRMDGGEDGPRQNKKKRVSKTSLSPSVGVRGVHSFHANEIKQRSSSVYMWVYISVISFSVFLSSRTHTHTHTHTLTPSLWCAVSLDAALSICVVGMRHHSRKGAYSTRLKE
jgi:hypothetical protein